MDDLSDEINALGRRYGRNKVNSYFKKLANNNKEIPATNNRRAILNFLKASYTPDVIISEGFLRSDILLGNTSQLTFSVNESDGGQVLSPSLRLNQNDTFEITDYGIFIYTHDTVSTLPLSVEKLYTYPNESVFNTLNESANLNALYNAGKVQIKLGTTTIFQALDALRFYRVPITQQGVAVSTVAGTGIIKTDAYQTEMYPFAPSVPTVTISGNGKNIFQINLPDGVDFRPVAPSTRQNYAVLYIRGFLCANGAKQQNKKFSV